MSVFTSHAQVSSVDDWNRERLTKERMAMNVLLTWGSVNLAAGVVGSISAEDNQITNTFSAVTLSFGAVNTTLGLLGIRRTDKHIKSLPSLADGYSDLRKTRNILLVNAGLDVGYVVAGLLLQDRSLGRNSNIDRRRGFGYGLIVQGGALLIFDSVTAWALSRSEIHISPVFTPDGAGLGFQSNLERKQPVPVAWF